MTSSRMDEPKTLNDLPGKDPGLVCLGQRPFVAETPEELLDDETTPVSKFFLRNNGLFPDKAQDADAWSFTIDGEVERELTLNLAELKTRFTTKTYHMVLECGGNGRSFFNPQTRGNPWTHGGVGCAEWTGVSLGDVLRDAGLTSSAVYTGHYGADPDVTGDFSNHPMSRGVPIAKALEEHTLLVWAMNGEPLAHAHGGPLRLVVPGWPGSLSTKWLNRIWIRDREHDGNGMTGMSYRLPAQPIPPGSDGAGMEFRIIESMPVRSIITAPADGAAYPAGTRRITVRGAAWAGDNTIARVELSADAGVTWQEATLTAPRNRYDWARWCVDLLLPTDGPHTLWAKATDSTGKSQPFEANNWNPQGYGCNAMHKVSVRVGD